MFWTEEKLLERIQELSQYRYRQAIPIASFKCQPDIHGTIGTFPPQHGEWTVMNIGERWQGRDKYIWLSADISVPEEWFNRNVVGIFDFGYTDGGTNSGFESLLYIDDKPYQGVDSNHKEVMLPAAVVGLTAQLTFRLWSGLEGGGQPKEMEHRLNRAEIAWLDERTDDVYFTARATLETIRIMNKHRPERFALLSALDAAFKLIDWAKPGSDDFYRTVYEAQDHLHQETNRIGSHPMVSVQCIGHTHIDVAWLWRLKHTREKAARSFSTVMRLMERYPEYIFLQTQPQLYEYIKSDYPLIYDQIRERVKEGRWEAAGGMWLEADCNLPSGESLVRQILIGTRFFRNEFGAESTYLWLPDVFGYSWALPQILKKSGINTFVTTKISWNQYNRMPHDTFMWRGIDGSEVLVHFITTPEPGDDASKWLYTYNGEITPETVDGLWTAYRDKSLNTDLLLSYGFGDGGGGVTRDMLEMRRRLADMPGLPAVKTGRADEYFERLHTTVKESDEYIHTWDGELYLEYHRGTYTSQAYNKRMNRKLELLYRDAEYFQVLQSVLGADWGKYQQDNLNAGWKIILRNQFHDIIPGSSIHEVYEDSRLEYEEAERIGTSALTDAVTGLVTIPDKSRVYTVFNSGVWHRTAPVFIVAEQGMEQGYWSATDGTILDAQRVGDSWCVLAPNVPAFGESEIRFISADVDRITDVQFRATEFGLLTPHYKLEWNERGQLTSIYDLEASREVIQEGHQGNVLQVFEDKPRNFDAWDIDLFYQEKMREVRNLRHVNVVELGPVRAVVRFEWEYMESTITQNMIVYRHSRRIDFETHVDWHEHQQLLKVAFPVDIRATEATYDIQFGNVKRPTHWNTSWDYARFETVGHQWVDLSEHGYGVSLLNDCKYGHDVKDNVIRLSLIKSAIYPDTEADQGEHTFTYSLFPHRGSWVEGRTVEEAWDLNNPLIHLRGSSKFPGKSLFRIVGGYVLIDAVKKAEDEDKVVLRLHEYAGARSEIEVTSDYQVLAWQESDLMERPSTDMQANERLKFILKPYEIKTLLIDVKSP